MSAHAPAWERNAACRPLPPDSDGSRQGWGRTARLRQRVPARVPALAVRHGTAEHPAGDGRADLGEEGGSRMGRAMEGAH